MKNLFILLCLLLVTGVCTAQMSLDERRTAFEQRKQKFTLSALVDYGANMAVVSTKEGQVNRTGITSNVYLEATYKVEPTFGVVTGLSAGYYSIGSTTKTGQAKAYLGLTDNNFIAGGVQGVYLNESNDVGLGGWLRVMYPVSPSLDIVLQGSGRLNAFNNENNFPSGSLSVGGKYTF